MRFAAFDIETTSLDASYGRLVCAALLYFDKPDSPESSYCRLLRNEPSLLRWITDRWQTFDVVVTWNGKRFDVPFVNARLAHHDMPLLEPKKHVDLLYYARMLRFRGARLDDFSKDVHLATRKYNVPAEAWVRAAEGHAASVQEIVKHNEVDVRMTYEAFNVLKPMIQNIHR